MAESLAGRAAGLVGSQHARHGCRRGVERVVIVVLIRSMDENDSRGGDEDDGWREDDGWAKRIDVVECCEAVLVRLGTKLLVAWSAFWVSPRWW